MLRTPTTSSRYVTSPFSDTPPSFYPHRASLTACIPPPSAAQITLNHIDAIKDMVRSSPSAVQLVDSATDRLIQTFAAHDGGQLAHIRQLLLRFFQDRRVKVSVFLQDGLQLPTGAIIVSPAGHCPLGSEPPGAIRYYDRAGGDRVETVEHILNIPSAAMVLPARPPLSALSPKRHCLLGKSMYSKERPRHIGAADGAYSSPASHTRALSSRSNSGGDGGVKSPTSGGGSSRDITSDMAKAELNAFAGHLGGGSRPSSGSRAGAAGGAGAGGVGSGSAGAGAGAGAPDDRDSDSKRGVGLLDSMGTKPGAGSFVLSNLFSLDGDDAPEERYDPATDVLTFGTEKQKKSAVDSIAEDMASILRIGGRDAKTGAAAAAGAGQGSEEEDDDLLALMDLATGERS